MNYKNSVQIDKLIMCYDRIIKIQKFRFSLLLDMHIGESVCLINRDSMVN